MSEEKNKSKIAKLEPNISKTKVLPPLVNLLNSLRWANMMKSLRKKMKQVSESDQIDEKKKKKKKSSGKKDACYHKVKSRYDVWPSAYASGALVKCRKVGAKTGATNQKRRN